MSWAPAQYTTLEVLCEGRFIGGVGSGFQSGWFSAECAQLERQDRQLLAWASVLPDLDGLGAGVDVTRRVLQQRDLGLYPQWHHWLPHGLPASLAIGSWTLSCWRLGLFQLKGPDVTPGALWPGHAALIGATAPIWLPNVNGGTPWEEGVGEGRATVIL